VQANEIVLDGGAIKANSTGNVAAGKLQIGFRDHLSLDQGSITTSANAGNGGAISIHGGEVISLKNSQITTSVLGLTGNGGDIDISAKALLMNTGFIQANTTARNASGGNVGINVEALLTSGNTLFLGGEIPYTFSPGVFGFNVIQAAAPTGVSGTINVAAPVLDISGILKELGVKLIDTGGLGRNPCQTTGGSSLSQAGRGGLPASARELLGPERALPPPRAESGVPDMNQTSLIFHRRDCTST
jgi:large exoprotein involved in heme utilization and adhesion